MAPDGSTKVLPGSSFRLRFDRFLLPASATRQSVCLQPLLGLVATLDQCTAGVALSPSYDPVHRQVTYVPTSPLVPGTLYTLSVLSPPDDNSPDGIRAFDRAGLAAGVSFELTTLAQPTPVPAPVFGDLFTQNQACASACPTKTSYQQCLAGCAPKDAACSAICLSTCQTQTCAGAGPIFQNNCAFSNCHRAVTMPAVTEAAEGMQLYSCGQILGTALGHVAHETQEGEHATVPDDSPLRFGAAMPIVERNNPGNSYLLYKLLVSPNAAPGVDAASPDEIARLRASVVVGMPMPADSAISLDADSLDTLSAWIAQGAALPIAGAPCRGNTDCCSGSCDVRRGACN